MSFESNTPIELAESLCLNEGAQGGGDHALVSYVAEVATI